MNGSFPRIASALSRTAACAFEQTSIAMQPAMRREDSTWRAIAMDPKHPIPRHLREPSMRGSRKSLQSPCKISQLTARALRLPSMQTLLLPRLSANAASAQTRRLKQGEPSANPGRFRAHTELVNFSDARSRQCNGWLFRTTVGREPSFAASRRHGPRDGRVRPWHFAQGLACLIRAASTDRRMIVKALDAPAADVLHSHGRLDRDPGAKRGPAHRRVR
jgi:hypothetical protein